MQSGFFGDLSPFQVTVSVLAFLTAAHTLYTILAKAKLKMFLTDSIGMVVPPHHVAEKFHIGCNLITTDPFPIAVVPRSSVLQFIEFKIAEGEKIDFWPEGRYEFNIFGWVNRQNRKSSPNITATFHIEIDHMLSVCLEGTEQSDNVVIRVPILEWSALSSRS